MESDYGAASLTLTKRFLVSFERNWSQEGLGSRIEGDPAAARGGVWLNSFLKDHLLQQASSVAALQFHLPSKQVWLIADNNVSGAMAKLPISDEVFHLVTSIVDSYICASNRFMKKTAISQPLNTVLQQIDVALKDPSIDAGIRTEALVHFFRRLARARSDELIDFRLQASQDFERAVTARAVFMSALAESSKSGDSLPKPGAALELLQIPLTQLRAVDSKGKESLGLLLKGVNGPSGDAAGVVRNSATDVRDLVRQLGRRSFERGSAEPSHVVDMTLRGQASALPLLTLARIADGEQVVRIGHVAALSGATAHLGRSNENAAKLAINDLNAKGLVLSGKRIKFELVGKDNHGDAKTGVDVARDLVAAKVSGVVGSVGSGAELASGPVYAEAGIPQLLPTSTATRPAGNNKTVFRIGSDNDYVDVGTVLGRYAVKSLHGKTFAVIDDRTAYGQGVAEAFTKSVMAAGGSVSTQQFTTDGATDFTSILSSVKAKKPDIVFYGGADASAGPMLRQMQQFGIEARFIGGPGLCSKELPELAGWAIHKSEVICAGSEGATASQVQGLSNFKLQYSKTFQGVPEGGAAFAYDAVMVMARAMLRADSADPQKYLPVLARTSGYEGLTGVISFDEKGDARKGALSIYTYKDNKREQIGAIR